MANQRALILKGRFPQSGDARRIGPAMPLVAAQRAFLLNRLQIASKERGQGEEVERPSCLDSFSRDQGLSRTECARRWRRGLP